MKIADGKIIREFDNKQIFNKIFDSIPIPLIIVDKNAVVVMINETFADYLGYDKEYLIGKNVEQIDINTRFPYVLKNKEPEIAWRHKFSNGHTAIVHRIPILDELDNVIFGIGVVLFQDILEFKDIINNNKQLKSELFHMKNELKKIQGSKYSFDNIIGSSEKMLLAKYMARKATLTNSNVLLFGESGTGKELFAHAIHGESGRSCYPFVKVNCAAIPNELFESELFGYEEGAFTSAVKGGKIGKFELANKGTIFLDEIAELPMKMQSKLLRVIQEREIERIGGCENISIDVRVIAATNKDLVELISENKFRKDLYYRLNVMKINIPPLRKRMDDLPQILDSVIEKKSRETGIYISGYNEAFLDQLVQSDWTGNVRELENVIERAINMSEKETLDIESLPLHVFNTSYSKEHTSNSLLKDAVEHVEKDMIKKAIQNTNGNKMKAARLLGLSRSSLYEKLNKYNI